MSKRSREEKNLKAKTKHKHELGLKYSFEPVNYASQYAIDNAYNSEALQFVKALQRQLNAAREGNFEPVVEEIEIITGLSEQVVRQRLKSIPPNMNMEWTKVSIVAQELISYPQSCSGFFSNDKSEKQSCECKAVVFHLIRGKDILSSGRPIAIVYLFHDEFDTDENGEKFIIIQSVTASVPYILSKLVDPSRTWPKINDAMLSAADTYAKQVDATQIYVNPLSEEQGRSLMSRGFVKLPERAMLTVCDNRFWPSIHKSVIEFDDTIEFGIKYSFESALGIQAEQFAKILRKQIGWVIEENFEPMVDDIARIAGEPTEKVRTMIRKSRLKLDITAQFVVQMELFMYSIYCSGMSAKNKSPEKHGCECKAVLFRIFHGKHLLFAPIGIVYLLHGKYHTDKNGEKFIVIQSSSTSIPYHIGKLLFPSKPWPEIDGAIMKAATEYAKQVGATQMYINPLTRDEGRSLLALGFIQLPERAEFVICDKYFGPSMRKPCCTSEA